VTTDYVKAGRLLARRDPVLRDLIREHGPCGLAGAQHSEPFRALVSAIISQQLSTRAAATIKARVETLVAAMIEQPGVRLPGQRRDALAAAAARDGLELAPTLHAQLTALADA